MAKYTVILACGHSERVDLIGPRRSREWRLERLREKLCDECWRAERERKLAEANAASAAANRDMELPQLSGTERQIAWAETIRLSHLRGIDELLSNPSYRAWLTDPLLPQVMELLAAEGRASWWIDHRDIGTAYLITQALKAAQERRPRSIAPEEEAAQTAALVEATVWPEKSITDLVAEVRVVTGDAVEVLFPDRRDDFRQLLRKLGYRWAAPCWRRQIGPFAGAVDDRAAEVGHHLLAAGFPVRIADPELRRRAMAGESAPEPRRWIMRADHRDFAGWFRIRWPKVDDLYPAARRLRGSRYKQGSVYVPAENYAEVLDFAETYAFQVSPGAVELADRARTVREAALIVNVPPPVEPEPPILTGHVPPVLAVPEEVAIPDGLRDD